MPRGIIRDPIPALPVGECLDDPSLPQCPIKPSYKARVGDALVPESGRRPEDVARDILERMAEITSFKQVREMLEIAFSELPGNWYNHGDGVDNKKGKNFAKPEAPQLRSLQKSYVRHRTQIERVARCGDGDNDAQIEPDLSDFKVDCRKPEPLVLREFARAQLVARFTVPKPYLDARAEIVAERGEPVLLPDSDLPVAAVADAKATMSKRNSNRIKEHLPRLIDTNILSSLKTPKEKKDYLSFTVGMTTGTVYAKAKQMQLTLGADVSEVVGYKSRLKGVTKLKMGDPVDGSLGDDEDGGDAEDFMMDDDMDAQRRQLFEDEDSAQLDRVATGCVYELQGTLTTKAAHESRKAATAEQDKLWNALRTWVMREELRKFKVLEWWKMLNVLKFVGGVCVDPLRERSVMPAAGAAAVEDDDLEFLFGHEDFTLRGLDGTQVLDDSTQLLGEAPSLLPNSNMVSSSSRVFHARSTRLGANPISSPTPDHPPELLASYVPVGSRPVIVIRVGPDASTFRKGKTLQIECFLCRTMQNGKAQAKPIFPAPLKHKGGFSSVLQNVCTMLRKYKVPLPGSTTKEYPLDPLLLIMFVSDCGSDVRKAARVWRKIIRAVNWHRAKYNGTERHLQCFLLQYICLMHQRHLLEGDMLTSDTSKEFLGDLNAVISAANYWLPNLGFLKPYKSHRWLTLMDALRDVADHRPQLESGMIELDLEIRKEELRATAKRAKRALAVNKDRFWTQVAATTSALGPVLHAGAVLMKHQKTVFADASAASIVKDGPMARTNFNPLFEDHPLLRPYDLDGLRLLVNLKVIMPRREGQLLTFPWLLNHLHHPQLCRRAARALAVHPPEADDFIRYLQTAYAGDIQDIASNVVQALPDGLYKVLACVPNASAPAAHFPESAHSAAQWNKKVAPSIQLTRLAARCVLAREDEVIPWSQYPRVEKAYQETMDNRFHSSKKQTFPKIDHSFRKTATEANETDDQDQEPNKLQETLDAACDAVEEYSATFASTPFLNVPEPLQESGRVPVAPGVLQSSSWDAVEPLVLKRASKTKLATDIALGSLVMKKVSDRKQEEEQAYYFFRQKNDAGHLLPVKKLGKAKRNPDGQQLLEYAPQFRDMRTMKHWTTHPKSGTTKKNSEYFSVVPVRAFWNSRREEVVFVVPETWPECGCPFTDVLDAPERKRSGDLDKRKRNGDEYGSRTARKDREVTWSSGAYKHEVAIPEKKCCPVIKGLYGLFRPEAGQWVFYVPLERRQKRRGQGWTADQFRPESSNTPNGVLSQELVAKHRRIALGYACQRMSVSLPAVTEADEEAAYKELSRYIKATESFDFSSSDESGESEID